MAPPRTRDFPLKECLKCGKTFRALMWERKDSEPYVQKYCGGVCRNLARPTKVKKDRHGYIYTTTDPKILSCGRLGTARDSASTI